MVNQPNNLGKALARAREAVGLSQEAAAEAVGLNRVVLSYYESGRRQPPLGALVALARLYGISLGELVGEEAPKERKETAGEVLFRSAPRELGQQARAGMLQFSDLVRAYVELLEDLGGKAPGRGTSPFGPPRPRPTRWEAARLAGRVREFLGLGFGPIDDLFRLVDEHILVFRLALGSDLDTAPSGFFYNHPEAGFCIVVNSEMTLGRQVFTLAHELAHAFFHSHRANAVVSMKGAPAEQERFADLFAGEFLVPGHALARVIDDLEAWEEIGDPVIVVHLQRHFGVSYAALLVRLRQEGFIDDEQYETLGNISPSTLARRLGYPVNAADLGDYQLSPLERFPDRFLRLVRAAIQKKVMTIGDAAETLRVSIEDIRLLLERPPATLPERRILEDLEWATRSE